MGQKLGQFLRVLGAGLSPQAFQAQQQEFAAEQATERARDVQIETIDLKQGLATAGVLGKAYDVAKESNDTAKMNEITQNLKELSTRVSGGDQRIESALKNSWAAGRLEASKKERAAAKTISFKQGKETVTKQWNPETEAYDIELGRGETGKGTTVNVDTGGSFSKELGKQLGRNFVEKRDNAISAAESLESSTKAVELLDSGVITGIGADFIKNTAKVLHQAGLIDSPTVANTEAYAANQAKSVAQVIKAFGAGTGLSDADREYAEKAAAGKVTMNEQSLRKIIDINARASRNVLNRYNKDAAQVMKKNKDLPFDLMVPIPEFKGAEKQAGGWSIQKIE